MASQGDMHYGHSPYYPPPPPWFGYPHVPPSAPAPAPAPARVNMEIDYPKIEEWLRFCDHHPSRSGENFRAHAFNFASEGYRRINQLTRDRISVEEMSKWLGIGKGTADLIIGYCP